MQIKNSVRTLTLASMLAMSVLSPLAAVQVHADTNQGSGSGSGSSTTQCETSSGMFDPATGASYKAGTKVDVNTKVGDTSDHKQWTCNADGSWHEALIIQTSRFPLPVGPLPVRAIAP
jgi:hypothetical protein